MVIYQEKSLGIYISRDLIQLGQMMKNAKIRGVD